jgi:transcriptional regulator with XRE-family HTH domain
MSDKIDFSIATSEQIAAFLCDRLEKVRLALNITQAQLAKESGVAVGTIRRLEQGKDVSLDTFIRVLMALDLQQNLKTLLPDPTIRPTERVRTGGRERKRARPSQPGNEDTTWMWADETGKQE